MADSRHDRTKGRAALAFVATVSAAAYAGSCAALLWRVAK